MDYIMEIDGLSKRYGDFVLDNISLRLPYGCIIGLVGENGAGKTTLIRSVLNLAPKDAGTVKLFGEEMTDASCSLRGQIGVVFDAENIPGQYTLETLGKVMRDIYPDWSDALYWKYIEKMRLPTRKRVSKFSNGMRKKLAIVAAISHGPKLLILDEPTSALDPVAREEILDLLLDFVQDETHSVLLSSHITGDLEKIADYISFLHQGKLVLSDTKDNLLYQYGILHCKEKQYEIIDKADILCHLRRDYDWQVLVGDIRKARKKYPDVMIDEPDIEEIILLLVKGVPPQ